ncbi:MAG: ABC transporter ATP-binding protein [Bacteroidia bacterium]
MIEVNGLYKKFGKLEVLNNINASFNAGECIALIGPNGCGKTTLIKSILGMVIPNEGTIMVKGRVISREFEYRKHIGYMPQIGRYPDNMTIGQVIEMVKEIRKVGHNTDEELLHRFRLTDMFNKQMRTLSGGTTQKVSATLAFLFNPDILILDEPTAGLDPLAAEILKEKIIEEKKKGKLVLITSHLLSELEDLITHVAFMQDGSLKFNETIDELKNATGQEKISKAIIHILKNGSGEQDH